LKRREEWKRGRLNCFSGRQTGKLRIRKKFKVERGTKGKRQRKVK